MAIVSGCNAALQWPVLPSCCAHSRHLPPLCSSSADLHSYQTRIDRKAAVMISASAVYLAMHAKRVFRNSHSLRAKNTVKSAATDVLAGVGAEAVSDALKNQCDAAGACYAIYWAKTETGAFTVGQYYETSNYQRTSANGATYAKCCLDYNVRSPTAVRLVSKYDVPSFVPDISASDFYDSKERYATCGINSVCIYPLANGCLEYGSRSGWDEPPLPLRNDVLFGHVSHAKPDIVLPTAPVLEESNRSCRLLKAALESLCDSNGASYTMYWRKLWNGSFTVAGHYDNPERIQSFRESSGKGGIADDMTFASWCCGSLYHRNEPVAKAYDSNELFFIPSVADSEKCTYTGLLTRFGIKSICLVPFADGVLEYGSHATWVRPPSLGEYPEHLQAAISERAAKRYAKTGVKLGQQSGQSRTMSSGVGQTELNAEMYGQCQEQAIEQPASWVHGTSVSRPRAASFPIASDYLPARHNQDIQNKMVSDSSPAGSVAPISVGAPRPRRKVLDQPIPWHASHINVLQQAIRQEITSYSEIGSNLDNLEVNLAKALIEEGRDNEAYHLLYALRKEAHSPQCRRYADSLLSDVYRRLQK